MTTEVRFFLDAKRAHFDHNTNAQLICVKAFERGYWPIVVPAGTDAAAMCVRLNRGAPEAVIESALLASVFGWDVPAAKEARDYARAIERAQAVQG